MWDVFENLLIKFKLRYKWTKITCTLHEGQNTFLNMRGWVQKFPSWHTKTASNAKCCEGYIAPSLVRLMYQYQYVLK